MQVWVDEHTVWVDEHKFFYVAGICVACQLTNGQSELLQLAVPSALLSAKQVLAHVTVYKIT